MKIPFGLVLILLVLLSTFALVECALDHKIVAGGLVDPITDIDAVDFKFKYPSGGCVNPSTGDVFLSDADTSSKPSKGFNRVFKVNAQTNVITAYAGNGFSAVTSGDGGLAINAGMTPSLCTVDMSGDLYLFDAYSNSIRVVNGTTGKISTLTTFTTTVNSIASDDTYIYYSINFSIGKVNKFTKAITTIYNVVNAYVTVAPNGVLYYSSSKTVTKRVPGGVTTIIAGKTDSMCASNTQTCGDDGLATDALLSQPTYLHVQDNGNVIILDGKRMRMVSTNGAITTLVGTGNSNSGSACGGATGDGSLARTATIDSAKFLFGFNNTVYFDDQNKFRFRKVENERVNAAFGVCEKNVAVGQGNKLIDTTFNGNIPYMAFDSQDNLYISARDTIFKVANGILKRIAGSEVGDYGNNGNSLNALISSGKIVLNSNNDVIFPMTTKIKKVETSTGLIKQFNITGLTGVKAVCLDASENLIIVDSCALKYFDIATQQVSQLSKSNSLCDPGTSGSFINQTLLVPYDCAVDKNTGDVYISEITKIKVIRKSDDKVYTVAGTGTSCNKANYISNKCGDGGLATNAKVSVNSIALNSETLELFIADLAWDSANDNSYSTIRKINLTSGIISTIAGTGSSEKESLSKSYVAYNNGEWADPLSTPLLVSTVYVNRGKLFFVDGTSQGFIRTFDSNNRLVSISGHYYSKSIYYNGENLPATESLLCKPTSIAKYNNGDLLFGLTCKTVDKPDTSSVWTTYSRIVKLDSATGKINTIIGNFKEALTPDGLSGLQTSIRPYRTGSNYYPLGIVVNDAGEVIYADSQSSTIRKLNVNGFIETLVGTNVSCANSADSCGDNGDAKLANLNQPTGLFLTTDNVLYIVDTQNNRVRKVENGTISTVIGSGVACPSAGSASCDSSDPLLVKLLSPAAVYVTKSGDVYVADSGNSIIRKLSNGVLSVITSSLNIPTGLFVDEYNNDVYVSDKSSTIRKFSKGVLSIYAGTLNNADYSINDNMSFTYPTCILQTNDGILVADTDAGLIRSVKPSCPTGYYGLNCEFFNCFGISSLNSASCNSVGNCTAPDVCLCKSDYEGSECQFGKCFGISRNSSNVCAGHGSCLSLNTCSCSADYYGDRCELPFCFSIKSNDSSVCSGNGDCIEKDQCSCKNNYLGSMCEIAPCFGVAYNASNVCSGNGDCISLNNCTCDEGFYGDRCELPYCFSIKSNDSSVCSGNGDCTGKDQCICRNNYLGSMCEKAPCFGIVYNSSMVCSDTENALLEIVNVLLITLDLIVM